MRDKVTCTLTGEGEGGWRAKFCKIIVYRVFLMKSFAIEEKRKNKLKKSKRFKKNIGWIALAEKSLTSPFSTPPKQSSPNRPQFCPRVTIVSLDGYRF